MDVILPVPVFKDNEITEITLRCGQFKEKYQYRIESFGWDDLKEEDSDEVFSKLDTLELAISGYDRSWELIQIYSPDEKTKSVRVLYRKKVNTYN